MLHILRQEGKSHLASVFVARVADGAAIEFVESVQPPLPREDKWVLILSTLKGCPFNCPMCDAGGNYTGKLSTEEILDQIRHAVAARFETPVPPVRKLKVQFARMGDPALNEAVLEVLQRLPKVLPVPGLMPCISTIAPAGREHFFDELLRIKQARYKSRFQMQFSLHTTDQKRRRELVPARTWTFAQMARYGQRFFEPGDRKITLNFAAPEGFPIVPEALLEHFSPEVFAVKLTPINPTLRAQQAGLQGVIDPAQPARAAQTAAGFQSLGYETIVSIGELEENLIGSNCGMFVGKRAANADLSATDDTPC
jgi:23S rRNA (adenine2503-C2)-methyltransferase